MISLILPYWMRQKAADRALVLLEKHYAKMDLEVIVVDDGSPVPFVNPCNVLKVRVIRMPDKTEPKSPITCWNVGVAAAQGDVVVLSCIEVLHDQPILSDLEDNVRLIGPKAYVLAAAWCPEEGVWHCHSSVRPPRNPEGTGIGFCAAMFRDFFLEIGGFDESYRDGAGYEDCDWINTLCESGAQWQIRDDLVVQHPKTDAHIDWGLAKFQRNFDIYRLKWPESPGIRQINFVCLNAQNYLGMGATYVNRLFDMVHRNMPAGTPYRFFCITDNAAELHPAIVPIDLPPDIKGWWGKIWMFKRGLWPDGERMVFFDLDTLILGSLADITEYSGSMAILRDFYQPNRGAPGVVLWEAGKHCDIYEEWEAQGRPWNPAGDLGWIESLDQGRYTKRLDRLQDLFPDKFVSFKAHCKPYPPKGAVVVCFHGEPRPHNCGEAWVELIWRVGGGRSSELESQINTKREELWANVKRASGMPRLKRAEAHGGIAVLVGGGPSLESSLGAVEALAGAGGTVFALNGAADYLMGNGIFPDCQIIIDARPENARFVQSKVAGKYFISATCDKAVFDALARCDVTVIHPNIGGIEDHIRGDAELLGGGSTVGLLAMSLAYVLGYRTMHLFGYDSSFEKDHHAYPMPENNSQVTVDAVVHGRTFKAAAWMVQQVQEFQQLAPALAELGCEIHTHGFGLLPYVAWCMTNQLKEAA